MDEQSPTLGEIGSKTIISIGPDTPLKRAIELMSSHRISCLVVAEAQRPVGIITERDMVRLIARERDNTEIPIRALMSRPVLVAPLEMSYLEGYQRCAERGVRHLILVDDAGLLAGIVTETDFMNHLGLDAYVEIKSVSSVMTCRPVTVSDDQSVGEALSLMSSNKISCVIVERDGRPLGILSERDVVRLSQGSRDIADYSVGEAMSTPVVAVKSEEPLHEAARIMRERRIRRLAVVDDAGMLVGIITGHDLVKGLESQYTAFLRQIIEHQGKELLHTRKRLNESLVLENILRASFDMAILAMDLECRVRYFNPAAEAIFNITAADVVGHDLAGLYAMAGLDQDHFERGIEQARRGGRHEFDLESATAGGVRYLHCRIAPIMDPDNHIQGFVHTLSDVTAARRGQQEHDRLTAELLQARKMEAIGHLTGGIAHDFNNILASVLGYTRLALDRYLDEGDTARCQGYLREVYKGGKRAQELVRQLLAFSRSSPQNPQHINLAPLIQEMIKMLRVMLPSTLSLNLELDHDTPPVFLDPVQLQQLLMNLVLNARDSIQDHGRITIGLKHQRNLDQVSSISHRAVTGDWVELSVADTGCGMNPEVLERAFDPFFTTKEIGRGSGMGLSVVHGIMTRNRAEILVDSIVNEGTCFRLLFPPSVERVPEIGVEPVGMKRHQRAPEDSQRHVLVADDEASVAGFIGELLERSGFHATVVTHGGEALDLFRGSPDAFDLVIADQIMPRLTGAELASAIHKIRPQIPIILATGFDAHLVKAETVLGAAPISVLSKPLEPEDLLEAVDSLLNASREAGHDLSDLPPQSGSV